MAQNPSQHTGHRAEKLSKVLVDTSLLIEQQKREKYAKPVRDVLKQYEFQGISSYSKLEFKRAWLQRLAYLHGVCRNPNVRGIPDVLDWLNRKLAYVPAQRRRLQTCLDQLSLFLDLSGTVVSPVAQLVRLKAHCKHAVLSSTEALSRLVTRNFEFHGTGCVRAEELPTEYPNGSLKVTIPFCKKEDIRCRMPEFFRKHIETLDAVAAYVDADVDASDEMGRMRDCIRAAKSDPTYLCERRNCGRLADAIIALDGKDMDEFAANNDAEWLPIAQVMAKPLVNPVKGTRTLPG